MGTNRRYLLRPLLIWLKTWLTRLPSRGENTDDDDGDQHEDERVLNQTLAFFPGEETANHCETSLEIGSN
jgi:hypothetical protein